METVLLINSILLIVLVLLQSGKAQAAAQIITGGTTDLFKNRKERGVELFVTRVTWVVGAVFFVISLAATLI